MSMGQSRDFGLTGAGKGSRPRTNTASKSYQKNYDAIFRKQKQEIKRLEAKLEQAEYDAQCQQQNEN